MLWADCDGEDAVAALERSSRQPSIVIASGTGVATATPTGRSSSRSRADEVERANRRLAHALGADPASADAARILRVPGDLLAQARAAGAGRGDPARHRAAARRRRRRRRAARTRRHRRATPAVTARRHRGDDPLLAIAPEVYVARLLGVEVPRHRKVRCPFHADRHASLHVYETAERGWYCFGRCRRGGTIYDLAAPLYGYDARGEDFLRLRAELRRLFGLETAVMADAPGLSTSSTSTRTSRPA